MCCGDAAAVSDILKVNLHSAVITREEALHIDKTYRTTMPASWKPGQDPFIRYNLTGICLLNPIHENK